MKQEPTTVNIGSLAEAWKNIGRVTVAETDTNLAPYKESDIDGAASGSLIKYALEKGTLPLMIRARLDAKSKSTTFKLKVAKNENNDGTAYEKFYDEAATITFTTSANAIAAERGGFYADGVSFDVDDTLKGFGSCNKWAKCTFGDILGFLNQALVCTAITGAWADIDVTNS
ncbi:hypothetical protein KAR91_71230 [Candidatus Pacearchaeota archaeon]|nr:hypothetical protein [Candidatus Pacearchaeota archaeon]